MQLATGSITHYVLNTGRTVEQPRSPLSQRTMAALRILIANGGGRLPGILSAYRCRVHPDPAGGWCEFSLWHGAHQITSSVLCWEPRMSATAWQRIEGGYYRHLLQTSGDAMSDLFRHAPAQPEVMPWMGRVILPGYVAHSGGNLAWVGDFERCLGWTMIRVHSKRRSVRRTSAGKRATRASMG